MTTKTRKQQQAKKQLKPSYYKGFRCICPKDDGRLHECDPEQYWNKASKETLLAFRNEFIITFSMDMKRTLKPAFVNQLVIKYKLYDHNLSNYKEVSYLMFTNMHKLKEVVACGLEESTWYDVEFVEFLDKWRKMMQAKYFIDIREVPKKVLSIMSDYDDFGYWMPFDRWCYSIARSKTYIQEPSELTIC
jgi:hypothetical protein